jgi:hypothetical protein
MAEPDNDKQRVPYSGHVSFKQVLIYDLTSFLTGLLYLFVVTCTASIIIGVKWLDFPPPRESPVEILMGFLIITAVAASIIRYRISKISRILSQGNSVTAEVVRGLAYQFFVQIQAQYPRSTYIVTEKSSHFVVRDST